MEKIGHALSEKQVLQHFLSMEPQEIILIRMIGPCLYILICPIN